MDIRALLAETSLLAGMPAAALDQLAARTEVVAIRSGQVLIEIGTSADHLYILAVGRLRVRLADGTVVNEIGRLEPVGEISLLSGEARSATVYAVRDSKVLKIDRAAMMQVFDAHPAALLEVSRTVIERLRQNQRAATLAAGRRWRSFALLSASPGLDLAGFAQDLLQTLANCGSAELMNAARVDAELGVGAAQTPIGGGEAEDRLIQWLQSREMASRHLLYVGDGDTSAWSQRCLRQVDRVLVLADAHQEPAAPHPTLDMLRRSGVRAPVDLVLLRAHTTPPGRAAVWRDRVGAGAHYFVRPHQLRDVAHVVRSLTGRALGLVLGGGGARGFAHIGLIRALEETGIEIDAIGGTSMGAFFAALQASGFSSYEMLRIARDTFVRRNLLNDYLFPSVALIRGRKFLRRMQEIFEDRRIEDLRTPFFCVSTNLTRGCAQVHDRGPLSTWLATSMCIPGVAPPVAYRGDLLVDGAVINSLPTDVMQDLERGPIIASDVSTEGGIGAPGIEGPDPECLLRWQAQGKRPSLFSILFRTATLTSESGVAARAARADLYLRMPVGGIGVFDWKRIDELVEIGYRQAMEKLPEFQDSVLRPVQARD
ncbi:patatin-like phospholipase family protein [Panacagrimonas sp.]|uniref:patatin-like phospholipase family protein n=1 Tax=Panacagrimonas sp. TaxID=2480088 RepID=UPI003B52C306